MASRISKKIELKFWDIAIPLLSNSSRLRDMTAKTLHLYHDGELKRKAITGLIVAISGFLCGFLFFTASRLFS